ncbi:hypothetical protein BC833DRAFT_611390 [Globomyces pollinis-pini]|nr:hypothetical protein BC833DRAFT_611390 [Globomyces pollinis-pini]
MNLETWQVALIFGVGDIILSIPLAYFTRKMIDKNSNGQVDPNELHRVFGDENTNFQAIDVATGNSIYEIATIPLITVLLNSWSFATAYGFIAVLTCNLLLPDRVSDQYGWLITLWVVFYSLVFMCAFANNGIHVATSHAVHFIYYGVGFIPLGLYARNPEFWLVIIMVVWRLTVFMGIKFYAWPKYPDFYRTTPLYTRSDVGLVLFSIPGQLEQQEDVLQRLKKPTWKDFQNILIPFPVYEILNIHVATMFTIGGLIAWPISKILFNLSTFQDEYILLIAVSASLVFGVVFVYLAPPLYEVHKYKTLTNYYPKIMALLAIFVGSMTISSSILYMRSTSRTVVLIFLTHAFHFISLGMYFFSYFAVGRYFGWIKGLKRFVQPGHAGLGFRKH